MNTTPALRIGTRGSPLALAQAEETRRRLETAFPDLAGAIGDENGPPLDQGQLEEALAAIEGAVAAYRNRNAPVQGSSSSIAVASAKMNLSSVHLRMLRREDALTAISEGCPGWTTWRAT